MAFWTKKRADLNVNEDQRHYTVSDELLDYGLADPSPNSARALAHTRILIRRDPVNGKHRHREARLLRKLPRPATPVPSSSVKPVG